MLNQISKIPLYLICFILATVPLLFGAVHPVVSGFYVILVLVGLGSWLCFFVSSENILLPIASGVAVLLLLTFLAAQSIPLPLSVIEILSPVRALRVQMVNSLAGTEQHFVSLSEHGLLSLTRVILFLAALVYYVSLRQLMHQDRTIFRVLVLIMILVGVFESVYGLFQYLNPHIGVLWVSLKYRAACGTIIYKNQYASLVNMCWPLALALAVIAFKNNQSNNGDTEFRHRTLEEHIRRLGNDAKLTPLFLLGTAIMLLAVLFSLSRGGIITMVLVMFLLNFFLPVPQKTRMYFVGVFVMFILGYGSLLGWDTLIARFNTIGAGGLSRLELYSSSFTMLMDHWLTGTGLGGYSLLSPIYLKEFPVSVHFDKAHNEYLQFAIELGIPMALFFFVWLGTIMVCAWKKLRQIIRESGEEFHSEILIGSAAFCGLVGFLFHGIADFGWRLPANLFYAATLAALLGNSMENVSAANNK